MSKCDDFHQERQMPNGMEHDPEFVQWQRERLELFLNPTLEAAQDYWVRHGLPPWNKFDVPLASVHKARLQWLDATDEMLIESKAWLLANGYQTEWQGAPPLTPEQRDADRVTIGKKPLGES
jgi:hypothetical protein